MNIDPCTLLYQRLKEEGEEEARSHRAPPIRFRASEAADCKRKIWYRLSGKRPAPRTPQNKLYGIWGDIAHDAIRQLFEHYGIPVHHVTFNDDGSVDEGLSERRVFTNENGLEMEATYRADGMIDTPKGRAILEIKNTGFWPFDWMLDAYKNGGLDGALKRVKDKHPSYYAQAQVMLHMLNQPLLYLVIAGRSTCDIGVYDKTDPLEHLGIYIERDETAWEEIRDRFFFIKKQLEEGVPPVPIASSSSECKFCDFRYLCHDAEKRRRQGLEPAVVYPGPQMEEYRDEEEK